MIDKLKFEQFVELDTNIKCWYFTGDRDVLESLFPNKYPQASGIKLSIEKDAKGFLVSCSPMDNDECYDWVDIEIDEYSINKLIGKGEDMKDFCKEIQETIIAYMPDGFIGKAEVTEVIKNNDHKLHGLTIRKENEKMSPVIYLEDFYDDFQEGRPMEDIIQDITTLYMLAYDTMSNGTIACPDISLEYEDIKDSLIVQILDTKRNKEKLESIAYTPLGNDLAMTYVYLIGSDEKGESKVGITREMVQKGEYDLSLLHKDALANSVKMRPVILSDIAKVMAVSMGGSSSKPPLLDDETKVEKDVKLLVLSNVDGLQGAVTLFYPGVTEQIAKAIDDNYFVLPSSVHEVLIVPERTGHNAKELGRMVKEVNVGVLPEEILSDKILYYDRGSKDLTIAS